MKTGHLLFSAVQFVFAVLVILVGGLALGIHYAPHLRSSIAQFFLSYEGSFSVIGYLTLSCGFLLLIGFYSMHRGEYYLLKMVGSEVAIDPEILRAYIQHYWNEKFPDKTLSTEVSVTSDQHLEITAEMPQIPAEEQKMILSETEKELAILLSKNLGYNRDFTMTILLK